MVDEITEFEDSKIQKSQPTAALAVKEIVSNQD
jgi:hypothetical protein